MTNLFENAFEQLSEAWETVIQIEPRLNNFEVNPQFCKWFHRMKRLWSSP